MSLEVVITGATNVTNPETFEKCDPYVVLEFRGFRKKTDVKKDDLNPVWNETFEFQLEGTGLTYKDALIVKVFDWQRFGRNRQIGMAEVSLAEFVKGGYREFSVSLVDSNQRQLQASAVQLCIKYTPPVKAVVGSSVDSKPDDKDKLVDGEGEGGYEANADTEDGVQGNIKEKSKKMVNRLKKTDVWTTLSEKPVDQQVRIKIVQARQLAGTNLQPVVRVALMNQIKQTRIKKSTTSPWWDESFFFNFRLSPIELADEIVDFSCDVGLIYNEPGKAFINKWVLLRDAEDATAAAKGYLMISACVLGPGDVAPNMAAKQSQENTDIESNLLRPWGVQLRAATFTLHVFLAEDIPRMDTAFMESVKKVFSASEKKALVDPYFVFSFAGKEVSSKIVFATDNPHWYQMLSIGLQFPSVCERIKLQIKDWDQLTDDDIVGTAFLPIISISSNGEKGFLPTFGPCFINMYGSTRNYSDMPSDYEDMNNGKREGVAYRCRALIQLSATLGAVPSTAVENMTESDIHVAEKFMRRRKYRVYCAFCNASMISSSIVDSSIQFEISMGIYGNNLDETSSSCASTTQPTNAVFDGCYYYFLPWANMKPCLVVNCSWEDISFRLESLNILLRIVERLEVNLKQVCTGIKAKMPSKELTQLVISLLDQLINDCNSPLSPARGEHHASNELDKMTEILRKDALQSVKSSAKKLRANAANHKEVVSEVEQFIALIKSLAVEPQNSMPDVIVWMLAGQKRIAYYRIPAYDLLYSEDEEMRGKNCGRIISIALKYPYVDSKNKKHQLPAVVQIMLWLGLVTQEKSWHQMHKEGELAVFAETYENQVNFLGSWTNWGPTMTRPKWSDSEGRVELNKEVFTPPAGWKWDGDWYINPEMSMLFDKDAGHTVFLEDLYECQSRNIPGGVWASASRPWTDTKGDPAPERTAVPLPKGWKWDDEWKIDLNRAVDEEGYEYCVESTTGGYGPVEKAYHLCRRRRWLRKRTHIEGAARRKEKMQEQQKKQAEGWEYAPLFSLKFNAQERRSFDLVRRRRWHRKMISQGKENICFFNIHHEKDLDKEKTMMATFAAPRMFLTFKSKHKYQMRAYIYQARDLLARDDTGLSDPFARVAFLTYSMVTEKQHQTLNPTWNQTLIFSEVEIYESPSILEVSQPEVYIEFFDYDTSGKPEFLGRTKALPMVKLDPSDPRTPVLQWYNISYLDKNKGELLASFELIKITDKDLPSLPPKKDDIYIVPNGITPIMQQTRIEILCWGVRNMKMFKHSPVDSPSARFECGDRVRDSLMIKDTKKNPNFPDNILVFDVMLPEETLYMPPMNIKVRDHRLFGCKPTVGIHIIKSMEEFRIDPLTFRKTKEFPTDLASGGSDGLQSAHTTVNIPEDVKKKKDFISSKINFVKRKFVDMKSGLLDGIREEKNVLEEKLKIEELRKDYEDSLMSTQELDWWSKYFASAKDFRKCEKYHQLQYDTLEIFNSELEKSNNYNQFTDFCQTFPLTRGKDKGEEDANIIGYFKFSVPFEKTLLSSLYNNLQAAALESLMPTSRCKLQILYKGSFCTYPLPSDPKYPTPPRVFRDIPSSNPEECIVRLYVVCASALQPADPNGLADPYLEVDLGPIRMSTRDEYVPNTINPIFGRLFELKTLIPLNKDLFVRLKDYDVLSYDETIGETVIDLEDRYLSKFRATCGLPKTYWEYGVNAWRDSQKPIDILNDYCHQNHIEEPYYLNNTTLKIGKTQYKLSDFEKHLPSSRFWGNEQQRLALHVLNITPLVKEHVEARPLFSPLQPNVEQGKVHMWVDIFPASLGPPGPPFIIAPRKPSQYVLRVVIWNTEDVILQEKSMADEWMSDIYVQGWMSGIDEKQKTDIHYRSLDGEGNFNWRFIFSFEYQMAEQTMVVRKKEHLWSLDETEFRIPPKLNIQIWDNDKFSLDDFLGQLELNLNAMPLPSKRSKNCKLTQLPDVGKDVKLVSLFEINHMKGFWPCYNESSGKRELTGKVEMELNLLTAKEAEEKPAALGRDEPNMHPKLEYPKRPETSFRWFTAPWKTMKHVVWHNYRWKIMITLLIFLVVLLIIVFVYSFPKLFAELIFDSTSSNDADGLTWKTSYRPRVVAKSRE